MTPDMVWNEFQFRTAGLALRILDPFMDEDSATAIEKVKAQYLRIWACTPRVLREILEEIVRGGQVKGTDFNGLIALVADLEDYRHQAALHGDAYKFDELETLMAIVAARMTWLEVKWSKFAIKKISRDEVINFQKQVNIISDMVYIQGVGNKNRNVMVGVVGVYDEK